MVAEPKRIKVPPGSELALLIKDALNAGEPILIDTGEAVYPLYVGEAFTEAERRPSLEDIARSEEGIRKAAGSWKDFDVEAFKADLYERRRASRRPPVRL
jgi:hypothetical protein